MGIYTQYLPSGCILRGGTYQYEILKFLGQGTFGITYLARVKIEGALGSLDSNVYVAIKEFFMRDLNGRAGTTVTSGSERGIYDKYKEKFTREAQNLSRLKHPHIVKVLELFEANSTAYYSMEYIDGKVLNQYIEEQNGINESECLRITRQIAEALSYMHDNRMLHLDLKPSNIVLRKNGAAVLIDFGLSKQYDENGIPESTTSVGGGTPGYAPIEQIQYHEGHDFPVTMDIYALGATMFKMLTGKRPPEASDILNDGFPIFELQEKKVLDKTISCIAKAMSPIKKQRYQTILSYMSGLPIYDGENTEFSKKTDCRTSSPKVADTESETENVNRVSVNESIPFPDNVVIKYYPKTSNNKINYSSACEFYLHDSGVNLYKYWHEDNMVSRQFNGPYLDAIKDVLISEGFLSAEHWEKESTTIPLKLPDTIDIYVEFCYKDNMAFLRHVENAHKSSHALLLNAVYNLVSRTSLLEQLHFSDEENSLFMNLAARKNQQKQEDLCRFIMPPNVGRIVFKYSMDTISYRADISSKKIIIVAQNIQGDIYKKEYRSSIQRLQDIIKYIDDLHLIVKDKPSSNRFKEITEGVIWIMLSLYSKNGKVIDKLSNGYEANTRYICSPLAKLDLRKMIPEIDFLLKQIDESEDEATHPNTPAKSTFIWERGVIVASLGILLLTFMPQFCYAGIHSRDLDSAGIMLVVFFVLASLFGLFVIFGNRNTVSLKPWNRLKYGMTSAFVLNTILLPMWNMSLTFSYFVLSLGLLMIVVLMFSIFRKN